MNGYFVFVLVINKIYYVDFIDVDVVESDIEDDYDF